MLREQAKRLRPRRQALLRLAEVSLWLSGSILIVYYLGVQASSAAAANEGLRAFEEARSLLRSVPPPDQSTWAESRIRAHEESLRESGLPEAVLLVPAVKLEVPIFQGTDERNLNAGVALIEGTAAPGEPGNLGIAGHRDGYFRALKAVVLGDSIIVRTLSHSYRYRVNRITVVEPTDVDVLDPTGAKTITLITCYPFYFVGHAPQRYAIQAVLEERSLASGGRATQTTFQLGGRK